MQKGKKLEEQDTNNNNSFANEEQTHDVEETLAHTINPSRKYIERTDRRVLLSKIKVNMCTKRLHCKVTLKRVEGKMKVRKYWERKESRLK